VGRTVSMDAAAINHFPSGKRNTFRHSPFTASGLAKLFEGAFPNFLYVDNIFFRVPMEILKSKIKCWSLPHLLLVTAIL